MVDQNNKVARMEAQENQGSVLALRYQNLRLRSALREMLRGAESDLRNNDRNPYRDVVLRARAALDLCTPNADLTGKASRGG